MKKIQPIAKAIEDIRRGRMIILLDDADRENEGDFVIAAEKCTPSHINTMATYGKGLICLPLSQERTRALDLPQQVSHNQAHLQTAFTISIDAARGIGTGISAQDRCQTILAACHAQARPEDLVRPGHIFPLQAREGGVLERPGHTEAAVDLARLAGLQHGGVICEILNQRGRASKGNELQKLAKKLKINIYTIKDLVDYRLKKEPLIRRSETIKLPTKYGEFKLSVYQNTLGGPHSKAIHLALTHGKDRFTAKDLPLVRVHSEWSIANIVRRLSHPSGSLLNRAMKCISSHKCGAIVFLRHTPFQSDDGPPLDQPDLPRDLWKENGEIHTLGSLNRNMMGYGLGAQILRDLGIRRMKLISNSDQPFHGIEHFGLEIVERIPLGHDNEDHE